MLRWLARRLRGPAEPESRPAEAHDPPRAAYPHVSPSGLVYAPPYEEWADRSGWDRYFEAVLRAGQLFSLPDFLTTGFLTLAREKGGRVWFPGCGVDRTAYDYAVRGCRVLATDFSRVAVQYQREVVVAAFEGDRTTDVRGTLAVAEHDFTEDKPPDEFDLVINFRAFQGLSDEAMARAATQFYAALRPGGRCLIDTMNVGSQLRDRIEDSLMAAGFYLPFHDSDRWYREEMRRFPPEFFRERSERNEEILAAARNEYDRRRREEAEPVKAATADPATIVAGVVYGSG